LELEAVGMADVVAEHLKLPLSKPVLSEWETMMRAITASKPTIRIALVGKYVQLHDAYMSVKEALYHAGIPNQRNVEIEWVYSADLEKDRGWDQLEYVDGVVVPGGFGYRGIEGKVKAARWARENKVPYLGLCLGMQVMCIEFGRTILDDETANSTEFDAGTKHPIINLMPDQHDLSDMGGTMRLGTYPCHLVPGSKAAEAYSTAHIDERHRHRWEFNNKYRQVFEANGMVFSGLSPNGRLVEISEIADHPFMVGSQFHPEFKSRPNRPHPLFNGFLAAAVKHQTSRLAELDALPE
jgi:CTP synthase